MTIKYSVVIPVFNESGSVGQLCLSLRKAMDGIGDAYEIIFCYDDSSDDTLKRLISSADERTVILHLARRRGKSAALQAGLSVARGEVIITMDSDMQNDPLDIPRLLNKLNDGCDLVCGWRYPRRDPLPKIFMSSAANLIRRLFCGERIHDVGCALRVMRKEVAEVVGLGCGGDFFFTAIVRKNGFNIGEEKIRHYPRISGKCKYGLFRRCVQGAQELWALFLGDILKSGIPEKNTEIKDIYRF